MRSAPRSPSYFLRWTRLERWQHWILAVSFILLAITGFELRFPEAWWARPLVAFESRLVARGFLHRLAATVFTALSLFHVGYLFTRRGRQLLLAMLPAGSDIREFGQNMAFLVGRRRDPPAYGHFSYVEKAEYWALVWGTVIMGVTGAMLWFEGITLRFLPLWSINIATTVHLYEAWLATLAIVVWHFYAVIFNPEVYPLNTSMVDGVLTGNEMAREHARELEAILRREAAAAAEPPGRPESPAKP